MTALRFNANESIQINLKNPPKNENPMLSRYFYKGRLLDKCYRAKINDFLDRGFESFLRQNPPLNPQCWLNLFPDGRMALTHFDESATIFKAIALPLRMRLTEQEKNTYPIAYDRCKIELRVLLEEALLRLK